jgi:xylan 1,4-beta-xylosidase
MVCARPSGTEDIYKIYAESFSGEDHLRRILVERRRSSMRRLRLLTPRCRPRVVSAKGARFGCALSGRTTPLPHVWEHLIGSDHAPMALRADWQAQLRRCRDELRFRYVRFHGLLSDDMSTLVRVGEQSSYSFFNADQIIDFLLSIGIKPFVELSFMPSALASGATTVFHYRGNVTPPRDYGEWEALIRALASHVVDRYGIDEVGQWYFEVWNEPNLTRFWTGDQDQYFRLYRHAASH